MIPVFCLGRVCTAFGHSLMRAMSLSTMFIVSLTIPPYSGAFSDDEIKESVNAEGYY